MPGTDFDLIIIGAGISGINAGYRVQTELPNLRYTILEARGNMGGTWDLFKYPGIRSDSDLHTFSFPWRSWTRPEIIASGRAIVEYIEESAAAYAIDKKILFHHKLVVADWSSEKQTWTLTVDVNGEKSHFFARFILFGTGYYNYDEPLSTVIPGVENFKGTVLHPQFWPADFDYTNKSIVVVGSGATAITLIPSLVEKASHVTMLQRSPSYILSIPAVDPIVTFIRRSLPKRLGLKAARAFCLIRNIIFYKFCTIFPNAGRNILLKGVKSQLPQDWPLNPNFVPTYDPWDQRICVCPDGDFFKSLSSGKASVTTGHIKVVTSDTIVLKESSQILRPDIIVTATGLKIQVAGGAEIRVDGKPFQASTKFFWHGLMLQDLPNAAVILGYTNNTWTLGADAASQIVCRFLNHMQRKGHAVAVPRVEDESSLKLVPLLNLKSTYVERAKAYLPKAASMAPWKPRANYVEDMWLARWGDLTKGMQFYPALSA
jgi:cation diffusion facilitator CzcD-associated flavoprotein CzcO